MQGCFGAPAFSRRPVGAFTHLVDRRAVRSAAARTGLTAPISVLCCIAFQLQRAATSSMKTLVLASASPRRRDMLQDLGVQFSSAPSGFHEPPYRSSFDPADYVCANACGKARSVAETLPGAVVIGADTAVVCNRRVFGKPADGIEARSYLRYLSGRTHAVLTGLCLIDSDTGREVCAHEKTLVRFRDLSGRDIETYLALIDPMDKAGAYAIQGAGALIVRSIQGCYYNVVGFPLARLETLLRQMGLSLYDYMRSAAGIRAGVEP